jgi:hypothetical protein
MARSRERGTGSIYLPEDPNSPGQKLQTWWISYYIDGKRKRESSKSRKKSDAQALLRRRMGEHALGLELGEEAKRLTFEDLEAGFRRSYENSGRRSLRRAGNAWDRLREQFGGWKARAITANALENYAADRLKEAAPATVQYELAVLRRAMSLAVRKGQLRSRPHFPHVGVHNARTGFFTREEMEKIATEIGLELGSTWWHPGAGALRWRRLGREGRRARPNRERGLRCSRCGPARQCAAPRAGRDAEHLPRLRRRPRDRHRARLGPHRLSGCDGSPPHRGAA